MAFSPPRASFPRLLLYLLILILVGDMGFNMSVVSLHALFFASAQQAQKKDTDQKKPFHPYWF